MTLQNDPDRKHPRWLSLLITGLFAAHFAILLVYNFSEHIFPEKLRFWSSHYVVPWFHQNLDAFAPEPPYEHRKLTYRLKSNDVWGEWQYPAGAYLTDKWENRFGYAVKQHEMVLNLTGGLHDFVTYKHGEGSRWPHYPIVDACNRLIRKQAGDSSVADSCELRLTVTTTISRNDTLHVKDSIIVLTAYAWDY